MDRNIHHTPDGPHYLETGRTRQFQLFFSDESASVLLSDSVMTPGFGEVLTGTVLGENRSRAGNRGQLVPYVPAGFTDRPSPWETVGRAPLVSDLAEGATKARLRYEHAGRFQTGDDLVVHSKANQHAENLGAITDIDISSGAYAEVTFTIPVTVAAGFTVANAACAYVATSFVASLGADCAADATSVSIPNEMMDGLVVGDELVLVADNRDAVSVGAVKTLTPGAATTAVEVTTAPGAIMATANHAMAYVRRPGLSKADGVLTRAREAGSGGVGSPSDIHVPVVFGHATLYRNVMGNLDAAAMADLGMRARGNYVWF